MDQYGLYSGGTNEYLSVSMFEYSVLSGEYSTHELCDVYYPSSGIVASSGYNGQRRYNVNKGSTCKLEFTYENNGEATKTFRAGYYLSTNSTISTADRFLGSTTFILSRYDVFTYRRSINIPSDLSAGSTCYLGVIVDDNNAVAEVDGSNNGKNQDGHR